MLVDKNLLSAVCWNLFFILAWDALICFFCKVINEKSFDFNKYIYRIKNWENNGKWYNDRLKIKKWKDCLPQYVSKDGFSKRNLADLSVKYIDQFILETCRGEWSHRKCIWIAVPIIFINRLSIGLLFLFFVLLINIPYICIQRYNRIRLIKIRNKIVVLDQKENNKIFNFAKKINVVDS